jgi:hypothetical protein
MSLPPKPILSRSYPAEVSKLLAARRVKTLRPQCIDLPDLPFDLRIELGLMVIVLGPA